MITFCARARYGYISLLFALLLRSCRLLPVGYYVTFAVGLLPSVVRVLARCTFVLLLLLVHCCAPCTPLRVVIVAVDWLYGLPRTHHLRLLTLCSRSSFTLRCLRLLIFIFICRSPVPTQLLTFHRVALYALPVAVYCVPCYGWFDVLRY